MAKFYDQLEIENSHVWPQSPKLQGVTTNPFDFNRTLVCGADEPARGSEWFLIKPQVRQFVRAPELRSVAGREATPRNSLALLVNELPGLWFFLSWRFRHAAEQLNHSRVGPGEAKIVHHLSTH